MLFDFKWHSHVLLIFSAGERYIFILFWFWFWKKSNCAQPPLHQPWFILFLILLFYCLVIHYKLSLIEKCFTTEICGVKFNLTFYKEEKRKLIPIKMLRKKLTLRANPIRNWERKDNFCNKLSLIALIKFILAYFTVFI